MIVIIKKALILFVTMSILFSACSQNASDTKKTDTSKIHKTINQPVNTTKPETPNSDKDNVLVQKKEQIENTIYKPEKSQDITNRFIEAIPLLPKSLLFDLSALNLQESKAEQTVLNAYFDALAKCPNLKYAYSIETEYDNKKAVVRCSIKYMPYKTADVYTNSLPAGTYKVNNLKELISAAQNAIGKKSIPIAITNPTLDVDIMQKTLMQAGYGYIVYALNNNATEIIAMPTGGRTMEQCMDYINKTNTVADEIISKIISKDMTSDEKVNAIYRYITDNVDYDQRYYTDKKAMPYESTTAYGALKYNKSICGGYSWAFNVLLSKVGIECYNVSGNSLGEGHIWNIAKYNGDFYYFDCTFDRGKSGNFKYFAKTTDTFSKNHSWDKEYIDVLMRN